MKTKYKVAVIAIIAVLVLSIIGLAIGLVLVAQQANMNNTMTISYKANNVDVEIVASAKRYESDTDTGTALDITHNNTTTEAVTVDINASDTADQIAQKGSLSFEKAENVSANGRAVYTFKITNTASAGNTRELKVEATVFDKDLTTTTPSYANDGNVRTRIGTGTTAKNAESLATTMTEDITVSTANVGLAGTTTYLVIVMNVDDTTMDVNDYELSVNLRFAYAKSEENPDGIAQDDWDGTWVSEAAFPKPQQNPEISHYTISITTAEQFAAIAYIVKGDPAYSSLASYNQSHYIFKLEADLDLKNHAFIPIGYGYTSADVTGAPSFSADFDGNGHTIRNLKIDFDASAGTPLHANLVSAGGNPVGEGSSGIGLFGHAWGAPSIKNLNVCNASVTGNRYVGVIVGHYANGGQDNTLENCHVTNAVVNSIYNDEEDSGDKAGAIAGYAVVTNTGILNCSATDCVINADRDAGQLFGTIGSGNSATVKNVINGSTNGVPNNTAHNVSVKWNKSSIDVEGYTKGNSKINQTLVGR